MPKTLHLTLTYHWWDKIASGEKNAEYRRFTANWRKRLADVRPGDLVVFHRGYTNRTITRRIEQIRVISGRDLPNKVGNVDDITYFCNTAKEEERNIAAHHDTEYLSCSDRAAHLVNGMLFSNGGEDGTNLVKVRTFTAKPEHYYLSRAEIYDRENCFRFDLTQGAKVWASDCADPATDKPMIDEPNAFTIIVHRHTLYVCVKGW